MKQTPQLPDKLLITHGKEIEEIFRRAVRHALWQHKQLGQSIAVSRHGQAVLLSPEEILVTDEDEGLPITETHVYAEN